MTKKDEEKILKWKLGERPTVENITTLLSSGVITKEEARKIVLDEGNISQSDLESIKQEISLLRSIVLELSNKQYNPQIIKIIEREIRPSWNWGQPYVYYCSTNAVNSSLGANSPITISTSGTSKLNTINKL